MGCHSKINPMGFAFEGIDNLGRIRDTEKAYSTNGAVLGRHKVDTLVWIGIDPHASAKMIKGGVEVIEHMMSRNRLPASFANEMHRFYRLRAEIAADSCILQGVYSDLMVTPNKSLLDAF